MCMEQQAYAASPVRWALARLRRIFNVATESAGAAGHTKISSIHVLAAIAAEGVPVDLGTAIRKGGPFPAASILSICSIDADWIATQLRRVAQPASDLVAVLRLFRRYRERFDYQKSGECLLVSALSMPAVQDLIVGGHGDIDWLLRRGVPFLEAWIAGSGSLQRRSNRTTGG